MSSVLFFACFKTTKALNKIRQLKRTKFKAFCQTVLII